MPTYDFEKQFEIGTQHEQILDEYFQRYFWVEPASRQEQRQGIDRWFQAPDGSWMSVEYKADMTAGRTGNAFIETISSVRVPVFPRLSPCSTSPFSTYVMVSMPR